MASYSELFVLRSGDTGLLGRFIIAVERAAVAIIHEDPATTDHASRMSWATRAVLQDAKSQLYAASILKLAIAESGAQLSGASAITDEAIQSIVDLWVPKLAAVGV